MERPITNSSIMPEIPQSVLQRGLLRFGHRKCLYGSKVPPPIQSVSTGNSHPIADGLGSLIGYVLKVVAQLQVRILHPLQTDQVPEWFNGTVCKTRDSGVRIPPWSPWFLSGGGLGGSHPIMSETNHHPGAKSRLVSYWLGIIKITPGN